MTATNPTLCTWFPSCGNNPSHSAGPKAKLTSSMLQKICVCRGGWEEGATATTKFTLTLTWGVKNEGKQKEQEVFPPSWESLRSLGRCRAKQLWGDLSLPHHSQSFMEGKGGEKQTTFPPFLVNHLPRGNTNSLATVYNGSGLLLQVKKIF